MANAHAEIGAIQQAHNAGLAKGANLKITVGGKDVCLKLIFGNQV